MARAPAAGDDAHEHDGDGARREGDRGQPGNGQDKGDKGGDGDGDDKKEHKGLKERPILVAGGIAVLLLVAIGGLIFWLHARNYESTDDAFVDAHMVRLAPQIAGRITAVMVNDNQLVQAGQPVVSLDSADAATRVAQAEAQRAQAQAQVDNARAQISVNQAGYKQALAEAAAAQAQADNAARDYARYVALRQANPAAVAQQQYDQAAATARQTADQHDSALRAAEARAEQVTASRTQVTSGQDQVRAAEAQLNTANINLGYTQIVAPITGHVAQRNAAVGNYVQPGTQLLAIVPIDVWVTANFKETQLARMRVGQHVDIRIDACPKDRITGHVDSIQRGAGQAFGILPPENATGNYVKVVQRVPVKILFDNPPRDCPIGPGMSVEPRVKVR